MTAPQPLATTLPVLTLPLKGLFAFVLGTAPPVPIFVTFAALVLDTKVLPFDPSRFFFFAVAALSFCDRLLALDLGKHLSGFFLSFEVPHLPFILPSVSIHTQSCLTQSLSAPITFYLLPL